MGVFFKKHNRTKQAELLFLLTLVTTLTAKKVFFPSRDHSKQAFLSSYLLAREPSKESSCSKQVAIAGSGTWDVWERVGDFHLDR